MNAVQVRTIARAVVGVALLAWLLRSVDSGEVAAALRGANATWMAAGGLVAVAALVPAGVRLQVLLRRYRVTFGWAMRVTVASYFFHQILPTGLGGDGYRSLRLKEVTGRWTSAIAPLVLERVIGAASLVLPAVAYALASSGLPSASVGLERLAPGIGARWTVLAFTVAVVGLTLVGVLLRRQVRAWTHEAIGAVRMLSPTDLAGVAILSLAYHALRILGMAAFLAAVGARVAPGDLVVVMALALLGSLVPVSLGALGVREGILVFGLAAFGVPRAEALAVALLNRLTLVGIGLAGYLTVCLRPRA